MRRINTSSANAPGLVRETTNYAYVSPATRRASASRTAKWRSSSRPTAGSRSRSRVTDEMMPRTVAIPQCWGHAKADGLSHARHHPGVNSNLLAGDGAANVEPLSGMSHLSGILVELRKAQPEPASHEQGDAQSADQAGRRHSASSSTPLARSSDRWASPEWNLQSEADAAEAHRAVMHMIEGGIGDVLRADPTRPRFQRIVSPTRKFTGDNADAIYYDAEVSPDHAYVVRGRMDGAVYVSITVECDTRDGSMATRTAGVINDSQFDVDATAASRSASAGKPRRAQLARARARARRASRRATTTRTRSPRRPIRRATPRSRSRRPSRPRRRRRRTTRRSRAGSAASRASSRSRTLEQPPMAKRDAAPFVSIVPNQFPKPVPPDDLRPRRVRRDVLDGAVRDRPRRRARHDRALAEVPLRERLALEPLPADARLREPAARRGTARRRSSSADGSFRDRARAPRSRATRTGSTPRAAPSASSSGASCSPRARSRRRRRRSCRSRSSRAGSERSTRRRRSRPRVGIRAGRGRGPGSR